MCVTLVELRGAIAGYAEAFDASLLSSKDAAEALAKAATIEHIAATIKALATVRSAETGARKDTGERSAAHHLARRTGTSVAQAGEAIETGRRLENLPVASAAARSGSLSAQQAAAVADAAKVDPAAEACLVEKARSSAGVRPTRRCPTSSRPEECGVTLRQAEVPARPVPACDVPTRPEPGDDPVLARRARIGRLVALGQQIGYSLWLVAIVVFVVGAVTSFRPVMVTVVIGCLAVGSGLLAPSIVISYGVRAADREDRRG